MSKSVARNLAQKSTIGPVNLSHHSNKYSRDKPNFIVTTSVNVKNWKEHTVYKIKLTRQTVKKKNYS